jgi:hypothetical protein
MNGALHVLPRTESTDLTFKQLENPKMKILAIPGAMA